MTKNKIHLYVNKMQNNPYKILGVRESDSLEEINRVYKQFMMILHPDKANTPEARSLNMSHEEKLQYLQMIRKAWKDILQVRQEQNYPDYNVNYEISQEMRINPKTSGLTVNDARNFNQNKFNQRFSDSVNRERKAGMSDPFNRGYGDFDVGKDYTREGTVTMPSYSADVPVETPKVFARPDMKDNRLVEYIPDSAPLFGTSLNHQELGITSVSDFSMTISGKGSISGTDLMSVYGQNYENWEDTVSRDPILNAKFNDGSDVSKRLTQMESSRGNVYNLPIDQKMLRAEMNHNTFLNSQEKIRQQNLNKRDEYFNELNRGKLNNGVPPR